jgi:hypothetical protein
MGPIPVCCSLHAVVGLSMLLWAVSWTLEDPRNVFPTVKCSQNFKITIYYATSTKPKDTSTWHFCGYQHHYRIQHIRRNVKNNFCAQGILLGFRNKLHKKLISIIWKVLKRQPQLPWDTKLHSITILTMRCCCPEIKYKFLMAKMINAILTQAYLLLKIILATFLPCVLTMSGTILRICNTVCKQPYTGKILCHSRCMLKTESSNFQMAT